MNLRYISLSVLVLLGTPAEVRAYRVGSDSFPEHIPPGTPVRWATNSLSLRWVGAPPGDRSVDELQADLVAAANVWNLDCSVLRLEVLEPVATASELQGAVGISWVSDWSYEDSAAATTLLEYEGGAQWKIDDAEVLLRTEVFEREDAPPLRTILAHELGHVLGLLHSCEVAPRRSDIPACVPEGVLPLMYPEYRGMDIDPSDDDRSGACFLYPLTCDGASCMPQCDTSDDCAAGTRCALAGEAQYHCAAVGEFGAPCAVASDCRTALCLEYRRESAAERGEQYCTIECADDMGCPADQQCRVAEASGGDRRVCAPRSSSCAASPAASGRSDLWIVMACLPLLRRRDRRS